MLKKVRAWLTNARVKAIQAALGSLSVLLVAVGYINDSQATAIAGLVGSFLLLAQGVLSLKRLRASTVAVWLDTTGRGLIYGAAGAFGAFGVAFAWWAPEVVTRWTGVLELVLACVSSFLAVVNVQTVKEG